MSNLSAQLRSLVAKQSQYRCAYCQSQQKVIGVALTIDHILPESLGGEDELENLCLSCWDCNLIKGNRISGIDPETSNTVRLYHPNKQKWHDHFAWSSDGAYVLGLTAVGRATLTQLKLNRPQLVESRRYWVMAEWHPPHS